jgi:hypothetical protein
VATIFASVIAGATSDGFIQYEIAAVLVLLPVSVVCDLFYSHREPAKKTGAASVVMIIHAVLFALFGIGALISAVFAIVNLATTSSGSSNTQVVLYSAIVIVVLYAAVFLRTLHPGGMSWIPKVFMVFMVLVVGGASVWAIVGPVEEARVTKTDQLIVENLPVISDRIETYTVEQNQLPSSLDSLNLSGDPETLITKNLVQYTPNSLTTSTYTLGQTDASDQTFYYQLCVTYTKADKNKPDNPAQPDSNGYNDNLSTTGHPAGPVCYKLKT